MVDTLAMPTISFTHSAADFHWPDLAHVLHNDSEEFNQREAVVYNPAIADWYFYYCVQKFIECYDVDILGVSEHWLQFEWQHRGSPHIHHLAWLANAPNVEDIMALPDDSVSDKEDLIKFIDSLICTSNPTILPDGSNPQDALTPRLDPHACNVKYTDVVDHQKDRTSGIQDVLQTTVYVHHKDSNHADLGIHTQLKLQQLFAATMEILSLRLLKMMV